MKPIRVFISSVQKELELERAAVAALIATDPFLLQHCVPVLFEREPPPPRPAKQAYLDALGSCAAYVLMIANEYGQPDGDISATHHEYRRAQKLKLPTIVFLKGAKDDTRSKEVQALIAETKRDGYTYKRFHDREDLKPEMLRALVRLLQEEFGIAATPAEVTEGEHLIDVESGFGSTPMADATAGVLDARALAGFVEIVIPEPGLRIWDDAAEHALVTRGLAIPQPGRHAIVSQAAFLLFAPRPADRFTQCAILADAYDEPKISGRPKGQLPINAPILGAVEQALKFIDDHTFHPRRVVGLNNVRLDEYPVLALREALINAVAHRNYDDATRKIIVRVFSDRVEIASPGYPLKPLTLAKLRKGNYRPCSRNPLIAETLALLDQMEQRGTGFTRMRDAMLDHGLDEPKLAQQDGFFIVTFAGPAGNYDRLKVPAGVTGPITPAIEAQLNERQRKALEEVLASGSVSSGWMVRQLKITYDTANRDLIGLAELNILVRVGKGRASKYVPSGARKLP